MAIPLTHLSLSVAVLLISLSIVEPTQVSAVSLNQPKPNPEDLAEDAAEKTPCIQYESDQKLIKVRCKSIRLTDIYRELNNPSILGIENSKEGTISSVERRNVWILDAGIVVEREGSLIIDSSDTSWLKITSTPTLQSGKSQTNDNAETHTAGGIVISGHNNTKGKEVILVSKHNGDNPNGIHIHGSLKIDSVKITSWDPEKNDVVKLALEKRPGEEHTKSDYDTAEPRAFIRISKLATGTTNITNSELAYLGYSCSRCAGLSYYGGEGSVIKGNDIHHMLKGFYSKGMGQMIIEDNKFHDNYLYGIDPHTGSHDIVIRKNIVYNNNASGIICSMDCHSLLIEGNEVYNNSGAGRGISFSINTTNSVARNNYVYDNPRCIAFNRDSNFNQVYNNTLLNCKTGVSVSGTSNNLIRDNKIVNVSNGIVIKNLANHIYNNNISSSKNGIVFISKVYLNATDNATDVSLQSNTNQLNNTLTEMINKNQISGTKDPLVIKTVQNNDTTDTDRGAE